VPNYICSFQNEQFITNNHLQQQKTGKYQQEYARICGFKPQTVPFCASKNVFFQKTLVFWDK